MASTGCSLALSLLVAALLMASGAMVETQSECVLDEWKLLAKCYPFMSGSGPKVLPSISCCDFIQKAYMDCVCSKLGIKSPFPFVLEKVCYVGSLCHNPLTPGQCCANYIMTPTCSGRSC